MACSLGAHESDAFIKNRVDYDKESHDIGNFYGAHSSRSAIGVEFYSIQ